ncbi:MAG: ABC transporter permease [Gemmatimonadales bacterium]|nr:ABC transporter permease [Gemmatimonadales bacterium]
MKAKDLWFRLRAVVFGRRLERELDREIDFHRIMQAEKLIGQGWEPAAAEAEARRRFGGEVRPRQEIRDAWGVGWVRDLGTDVRQALRQFRRRPAYSVLGVLTLALGIGATVGLFGVVRAVLLRPLPVADESALRVLWMDTSWRGVEFDFLQERTSAFSRLAAYGSDGTTLRTEAGSTVLLAGAVSAELFDVLGSAPALGRTFRAGEDRPGAERGVVLSHRLWQRQFGADPAILGRAIVLDGRSTTVIGVMPRDFYFPTPEYDLWSPLDLDPASGRYQGNGWLVILGRLRPGTTPAQEQHELATFTQALGERFTYPAAWDKTKDASLRTLRDYLVGNVRPVLLLLLGAGALLLLMACANVAALVLARTTDRGDEMALRAALGAGRARLARQIIAESLTFSVLAAVVGVGIALAGFPLLVRGLPLRDGMATIVTLDWSILLTSFAVATLVGLAVALAPVRDVLRGGGSGISGSRSGLGLARGTSRAHELFVGIEAAVAVILVVGALLLVRSVSRLLAIDLGFETAQVVAVDVVGMSLDQTDADRVQTYALVAERVAQLPGVGKIAYTSRLPIRDGGWQGPVSVEGNPVLQGTTAPNSLYRPVSPSYFEAMGIAVLRGRGFETTDRTDTQPVAIVSASFAEHAWPGQDPIGRQVRTGVAGVGTPITVVGVAEDVRSERATGANPFVLYVPDEQRGFPALSKTMVLRVEGAAAPVFAAVARIVNETDRRFATARPVTMEEVVAGSFAESIQLRFFLTVFAGVALVLGTVGVYSVVSYSVARRRAELGVRMALGAAPGQVLREVILRGVLPVGAGIAAGLVLVLLLARTASRFVYGVSASDPVSISLAALVLAATGLAAAAVPATRASRLSPMDSLRRD